MHIVERKGKDANPNGTFKTMMLSMITKLVEGEKLKGNYKAIKPCTCGVGP
jgi:hypothetical protein